MANMTPAERLRAALIEESEKKTRTPTKSTGDNASFPFWNIPDGSTATVRFLPDADTSNPFFWVSKETIKLEFDGQVGGDYPSDKRVEVTVPCVDMFGDTCPIIAETRPWWKQDEDKVALARKYYKKKSYIFQGFVVNSPLDEPSVPENPIRRLIINPSIFEIIKTSLMNPEMEDMVTDYLGGRDFKIAKTKKGEYANYTTSTWSLRTRALNELENVAIQQFGLFNLADFRGPRPDADGILMIKAMFHDSLAGKPFDFDAYGKSYRAYGDRNAENATPATSTPAPRAQAPTAAPKAAVASEDASDEAPVVVKTQASDVLDRLKKKMAADKA